MSEISPLLHAYLQRLAAIPLPAPLEWLLTPCPLEPGQAARVLLTGPRGCGKTTTLWAHAVWAAREMLESAGGPMADVLLPLAQVPLYLDARNGSGAILDMAAAAMAPDDPTAGQESVRQIFRGPALLLLDHVESLPADLAETLGEQLTGWDNPELTILVGWRDAPGHPLPHWLAGWPRVTLGDWEDARLLRAVSLAFPDTVAQVARRLARDRQVWQAAHRPLYFEVIAQVIRACPQPSRAELARHGLAALLDRSPAALEDWFEHAGFGACRLAWMMAEQNTERWPVEEAARVVQEADPGGVTLDTLTGAGVLTVSDGLVAFDQPLIANLCAAWYARARPERFRGGEQAAIGLSGRARALHHALDLTGDPATLLCVALEVTAPPVMFEAAAGWLMAAPPDQARQVLSAMARQARPEAMILLAQALEQGQAPLADYAAELARAALRTAPGDSKSLPGPAAPPSWSALRRAWSYTLRATIEQAAGRPEAALHSARSALAASTAAAAWTAHEVGLMLFRQNDPTSLQVFEFAITLQPEEAAHHLYAGRAALMQGDAAKALACLQQAHTITPSGPVCLALAEACVQAGSPEPARIWAEQAATLLEPEPADGWQRLGQVWAALAEPDRALQAWQRSLAVNPAESAGYVTLAQGYLKRGQTTRAIQAGQIATLLSPDDVAAHRVLGQAYLQASRRPDSAEPAAHHLKVAWQAQSDDAELGLLYGDALTRAGRFEAAVAVFERVLNLRPGDLRAAAGLARLYAEADRPADAQAVLDWVVARQADYPAALAVQGLLAEKRGDLDAALQKYAQALTGAPEDAPLRLQRAHVCQALGRFDEAQSEIERVLALEGEHEDALCQLAQVHLARQQPAAALDCLRRIERRPFDAETLYGWGRAYLESGDPLRALKILAQAARRHHAAAFEGLGDALVRLNRPAQAIPAYKYALTLSPTRPTAYSALGRAYRQMGCVEESVAVLSEATRRLPDDARCHVELGQSFAQMARWSQAEEQFARATTLAPEVAEYWRWYGRALRHLKRWEAAHTALERARQLSDEAATAIERAWLYHDLGDAPRALAALEEAGRTTDMATLIQIGRTLREFGEPARAEEVLLVASQANPDTPMVALYIELGQARLAQNRLDPALAAFEQAVALDPHCGESHAALAGVLAHLGRLEMAVQEWQQARALGYESADSLHRQAQTLHALKRDEEALAVYDRLMELRPRDAQVYLAAAQVARATGDHERALTLAGWATSLEPTLTPAYVLIGEVCLERGQPDRALAALKRAAQLAPGDRPVWLGLAQAALDSGQAEMALHAAQQLMTHDEHDADAWLVMGTARLTRREWRPAIEAFTAVLARRARDPDAAWGLGRALAGLWIQADMAQREGLPASSLSESELENGLTALSALSAGPHQFETNVLKILLTSLRGEKALAAGQLKATAPAAPPSTQALHWMAIVFRRAGAVRLGLSTIGRAAWLDRRNALLLYELGVAWEALGSEAALRRARSAYRRAAALEPNVGLYAHALARVHLRLEETGLARQSLETALALGPELATWQAELGQVCADQNDWEAAAQAYERACRLEATPIFHRQLSQAYARLGRHAAAVAELETALRHSPHQVEWWVELGTLHYEAGAGARALVCYRQALAYAPDEVNLVLSAAQVAGELGRWDEALELVENARGRNPASALLQARAGLLYERLGQQERALEAYTLAAHLAPQLVAHHLAAGRLALQLGQAGLAACHLENAIRTDPRCHDAYGPLGDAYLALGRQDEALQVYQHAATLEPGNVEHRLRLGRLYRGRNDLDQALAHLQVAGSLAPDHEAVLEEMIGLHEERREFRQALHVCRHLIQVRAAQGRAVAADYFRAGMLHKQLKEYPEALDMFRQATRLSPNMAEAYKQMAVVSAMGFFAR